jgi:hypothetical protein
MIIHTNHKFLIHFLKSNKHESIYDHWVDKMRDLNINIQYNSERRNRVTDELSRIMFRQSNCMSDQNVEFALKSLHDESFEWIWKNDKIEYEEFLYDQRLSS